MLGRPWAGGSSSGDAPLAPRPRRWHLWAGGARQTPRGGAPGRWVRGASRWGAACLPLGLRSISKGVGLALEKDLQRGPLPRCVKPPLLPTLLRVFISPAPALFRCPSTYLFVSHLFRTFHGGGGGGGGRVRGTEFSRQGSGESGPVQSPVFLIHTWPRILSNWLPTRVFCLPAVVPIWVSLWVL